MVSLSALRSEKRYIALAVLLFAQFGIAKAVSPEPYPLIVFPGGASTIRHGAELSTKQYELVATDGEGRKKVLDLASLFSFLPEQYRFRVVRHMLGAGLGSSSSEREETRRFLRQRFEEMNLGAVNSLEAREVQVITRPAKGAAEQGVARVGAGLRGEAASEQEIERTVLSERSLRWKND